jgi:predicted nuclease of predicted toxin-antitoxin system
MKVLLDQNLPRRAVQIFGQLGIDAVHVSSVKLSGKPDLDIWRFAADHDRVIITKDSDFIQIQDFANRRTVKVVHLRIGNTTNKFLFLWLRENWSRAQTLLDQGHNLIELA